MSPVCTSGTEVECKGEHSNLSISPECLSAALENGYSVSTETHGACRCSAEPYRARTSAGRAEPWAGLRKVPRVGITGEWGAWPVL